MPRQVDYYFSLSSPWAYIGHNLFQDIAKTSDLKVNYKPVLLVETPRLMFPFAITGAADLLDALPRHQTAHGALLADVVDLLRETSAPSPAQAQGEQLSPSELRVLRYLPTNLTRPEIARELYVSVNTVNTHVRSIYLKLGARDRSAAVRRARELRLLSAGRPRTPASWRRCAGVRRSGTPSASGWGRAVESRAVRSSWQSPGRPSSRVPLASLATNSGAGCPLILTW